MGRHGDNTSRGDGFDYPEPERGEADYDQLCGWALGGSLAEVRETTTISDGYLVRNFRMAIQLMRQVRAQLKGEEELRQRFQSAIELMDRDEVDARKQLELG